MWAMKVRKRIPLKAVEHTIQEESSSLVVRRNALQKSKRITDPVGSGGREL